MTTGWLLAGGFLVALGLWYLLDPSAAERRWATKKVDLLRLVVREQRTYVLVQRIVGATSIVLGIGLVVWGMVRPA